MSQSNSIAEVPRVECICHKMSTWDFLQDFYRKVDMARQYSQKLEYDLNQSARAAQQSHLALAQCERALEFYKSALDGERLEHGVTRKALDVEQQSHRETEKLFDLTYEAAQESGELVDGLRAQIAELKGEPTISAAVPTTADLLLELQATKDKLLWLEAFISSRNCRLCNESLTPQQPRQIADVSSSTSENSPSTDRKTPTNEDPQGLRGHHGMVMSG